MKVKIVTLIIGVFMSLTGVCQKAESIEGSDHSQSIKSYGLQKIENQQYHRARVVFESQENLESLIKAGVCMDHGSWKKGVWLESDFSDRELKICEDLGVNYEIIIPNVQSFYKNRFKTEDNIVQSRAANNECGNSEGSTIEYDTPDNFDLGSMGGYFTLEEAYAELDAMSTQYPDLITARAPISDFETYEERSIYWVRMSDNANTDEDEPEMLYDAVHHAREPAALSQLIFFMWYLLENYDDNAEVQSILNNTQLYFIPIVNPDGYKYNSTIQPNGGGMWRKNRRNHGNGTYGVDNNRNYDYFWGTSGVSDNTNGETWPGTESFSEPENQAVRWMCENHDFKIAINNHTYSDLLLYPFGYDFDVYTPEQEIYEQISNEMVSQNNLANILAWQLYPAAGDSDDFMYVATDDKPRIFAFTPEIGTSDQGFWPDSDDIIPISESMMYHNLVAAHMVTSYAQYTDLSSLVLETTTGDMDFTLKSFGMDGSNDYTVSFEAVTTNITFVNTSMNFDGMNFLDEEMESISYDLDASINFGDAVEFEVVINHGSFETRVPVSKIYGVFEEALSDAGDNEDDWSGQWESTTEDFVSSSTSYTDSPFDDYDSNDINVFELDESIDLTDAYSAILSFYAKWDIEQGWDYAQVSISTNNGATWIPQCGLYTVIGNNNQDQNEPVYDGTQNEWVLEQISLNDYLGEEIKIQFRLVSDQFVEEDGFYVDDLKVDIGNGPTSIHENDSDQFQLSCFPNPAHDFVIFDYNKASVTKDMSLVIYNTTGQKVEELPLVQTTSKLRFDTKNLTDGIYYYQLLGNGSYSSTEKFVLIR